MCLKDLVIVIKSQNSRIYNILKMVNLEDRIIDKNIILNNSSISIVKYKQIKEILDEKLKIQIFSTKCFKRVKKIRTF